MTTSIIRNDTKIFPGSKLIYINLYHANVYCPVLKIQEANQLQNKRVTTVKSSSNAVMLVLYVRLCVCSVVSNSLQLHGLQPTRLLCPWDSPGKNTRVGCHFFLQGIFLTQELDRGLLHWQVDSLPLSHKGNP